MKLLLLQPPVEDFYDTDVRLQPLGLCFLKSIVQQRIPGVEVLVMDFHQGHGRRTVALPKELRYLQTFYPGHDTSPFSSFSNYYHFGADYSSIAAFAQEYQPDLVGIASLFSPYYREVLACARSIKQVMDVPILAGGSHVSAAPLTLLEDPAIDFVIQGEGERPFVEFLQAYIGKDPWTEVPNLGWKDGGRCVLNPVEANYPFDTLPCPDLSDLDPATYLFERRPMCFVTTSRGCPHACAFCSVHLTFGHGYQKRTPEKILDELRERYAEGYRVFDFEDDNLSLFKDEFRELLHLLIREFQGRDVRFVAMNGISYLHLDQELLDLMREAGFTHLNLSLVSARSGTLSALHRPHTVARFRETVALAYARDFQTVAYLILGLPSETLDDMIATLALLAEQPVLVGASIFYLTPGCPITQDFPPMSGGDIFKARSTAIAVETQAFDRGDIYTLFVTARIINFFKGLCFEEPRRSLQEALDWAREQGGRSCQGAEILSRLATTGRLYGVSRQGFFLLPEFRKEVFDAVMAGMPTVQTTGGTCIDLGDWDFMQNAGKQTEFDARR